jgi:hypothetical protein
VADEVRLFAFVRRSKAAPKVRHYVGLPPAITGSEIDDSQLFPPTRLVIIDVASDGTYLFRFDADGNAFGDTWHLSVDDAREQAAFEFEGLLGEWEPIPHEASDLRAFARDTMGRNRLS